MSVQIVEVQTEAGASIFAEVRSTGGGDVSALDRLRLDQAGEMIRTVGRWAVDHARSAIPDGPDAVEVSFGIKLGTKSGALIGILAEASGEASLTVTLKWTGASTSGSA